jgi:octaprenyl-diphosphate synthase
MQSLVKLKQAISNDLNAINHIIHTQLTQTPHPKLSEITHQLSQQKGKQVRASIVVLIAQMSGVSDMSHTHLLAAGIELIHLASLIHDDIIDEATHRRNQPCLHQVHGTNNGIIMGVYCYSMALLLFSKIENTTIISGISMAVSKLCEGEFIQVNERHNTALSEDDYWDIVDKKTSALFVSACVLTAQLGQLPSDVTQSLQGFGQALGDIFQLADDYLDIYDTENRLSKKVEQDLITGDISLPIILAAQLGNTQDQVKIKQVLIEQSPRVATKIKHQLYVKKEVAETHLNTISPSFNTQHLHTLLKTIMNRIQ